MRNKEDRIKVDRLFVMGAGASYSATQSQKVSHQNSTPTETPLDKDFTSVLWSMNDKRSNWIAKSRRLIRKQWQGHIPFPELGLEEAIQSQAANVEFLEGIKSQSSFAFDKYLRNAAHLMAFQLNKALETDREDLAESEGFVFQKFARDFFSNTKEINRIITFNYDVVLDKLLLEHYGIEAVYSWNIPSHRKGKRQHFENDFPILVKLHGSINWRCTRQDFLRMVNGVDVSEDGIWYDGGSCPDIDSNLSPCIIPPIEAKPTARLSIFQSLWSQAWEYLSDCKHLYICGYSLPPTDALAAALFKNFANNTLETVTVIDPDPSIISRWLTLLKRNEVSNNKKNIKWSYHSDFGEFVFNR